MKKSRYTEEQIIGILKQHEAGMKTADLCREHGMSRQLKSASQAPSVP
jgi:putative transposase